MIARERLVRLRFRPRGWQRKRRLVTEWRLEQLARNEIERARKAVAK